MKAEIAKSWCAALRSGEYKQGREGFLRDKEGNYCCLGVLSSLYNKEHAQDPLDEGLVGRLLLRGDVAEWSGVSSFYGRRDNGNLSLSALNDGVIVDFEVEIKGIDFGAIADIIEAEARYL